MARLLLCLALLVAVPLAAAPAGDHCDIALLPAATLLLPYFEVDVVDRTDADTRFTIVNTTDAERIAHVTLWTDRAYPVLGFNVHLTGYDMATIDLYDVIVRGQTNACDQATLPDDLVQRVLRLLTIGSVDGCSGAGSAHTHATGYVTVDVVGSCSAANVEQAEYWTRDLRHDNALTGDYESLSGTDAQGGPLVHIRADRAANFPRTFYSRQQSADAPRLDARQPLPSRFAAHWIDGGPAQFRTDLKIWRESDVRADAPCSEFMNNDSLRVEDVVRLDESENGVPWVPCSNGVPGPNCPQFLTLRSASRRSIADPFTFPQITNGNTSGWIMLNLARTREEGEASQAWVTATLSAGSFSADVEAVALGNGCAPAESSSNFAVGVLPIAPSRNDDDSCDIALLPAATLLLPGFRVDVDPVRRVTTLMSITNLTAEERIVRVTLWTDLSVPILTFNVFLTGYDMQSIDLYDVIARGLIAPPGGTSSDARRGPHSVRNPKIERGGCERLPGPLASALVERMIRAFMQGRVDECDEVGLVHTFATGYATADVVNNCASVGPEDPSYWTRDVAFDNVLTGDYQVVDHARGSADGSPMVHIRAMPEAHFPRTFYARRSNGRDARQPLPSTFAAPWSTSDRATLYDIWREAPAGVDACGDYDRAFRRYVEIVRFDESENAVSYIPHPNYEFLPADPRLPSTSRTNVIDTDLYPQLSNGATSGWMYFNLDDPDEKFAVQAWIAGVAARGNGCSPRVPKSANPQ